MAWRIDKRAYLVEVRFALGAAAGGPFSNPSLMLVDAESHAAARARPPCHCVARTRSMRGAPHPQPRPAGAGGSSPVRVEWP